MFDDFLHQLVGFDDNDSNNCEFLRSHNADVILQHLFQVIYKSHEQLNRYVFKRHLTDCKEKNAADRGLPNSGEWSGSDSTFLAADVHRLCKPRCDR